MQLYFCSFFNFGCTWGGVINATLRSIYPKETDPVLILWEEVWAPQQVRKISPEPGFDPRTVRPVASRYTDYAIPATYVRYITGKHFRMLKTYK